MVIGRYEPEEKSSSGTRCSPPKVGYPISPPLWSSGKLLPYVQTRVFRRNRMGHPPSGDPMEFAAPTAPVAIKVLKLDPAAQLPRYAHTGPYGDLAADLYALSATSLPAGATASIATGVAMEFPSTHGALVEDR